MKTPAEQLAAKKKRERKPRNKKPINEGPIICHAREKREALELTIRDVADAVEMTTSGYHQVEMGGNATMETAFKLCEFFGCKLDELWTERV